MAHSKLMKNCRNASFSILHAGPVAEFETLFALTKELNQAQPPVILMMVGFTVT